MPGGKTIFRDEWLQKRDSNGHLLENWCQKQSKYEVSCKFCKKNVRCDNRGLSQLIAHSETKSHVIFIKDIVDGKQQFLLPETIQSTTAEAPVTSSQNVKLTCFTPKNNAVKAELLWCMKVASANLPYNCANDLNELFCAMFPDSNIASQFSVRPAKLSYMITEAIGPYFHDILLYDVRQSNSTYTLCFDELTNKEVKKQIDIKIKYWSNASNKVEIHHLNTYLISWAKGKDISEKIISSIDDNKLPLKYLLTLGSDGPNVNKTVFSIISEAKKSQDLPALLDVGTCNLHVVHGAFGKAVKEYGGDVVDLVLDMYNFFKLSPVRMEEFRNIQDEFIRKGTMAHKSYLARLEEEKRKKAELKKKKEKEKANEKNKKEELERQKKEFDKKSRETKQTILKEKSLEKKEDETNQNISVYKSLVDEANERIKMALKRHDLKEVQIGQTMLEAAVKKVDETTATLKDIRSEQKDIEKSKRTMLDYFCSSQCKKFKK